MRTAMSIGLILALAAVAVGREATMDSPAAEPGAIPLPDVERDRERLVERGSVEVIDGLTVLRLSGGPYEMGFQHGRLLRDRIRSLLEALHKVKGSTRGIAGLMARIPRDMRDEIRGIGDGAGITLGEALLLSTLPGRATAAAPWLEGTGAAAGLLRTHAIVLVIEPARGHPLAGLGWTGGAGAVAAISDEGMALTARIPGPRPGPMPLRLRHAVQFGTSRRVIAEILAPAVGPATARFTDPEHLAGPDLMRFVTGRRATPPPPFDTRVEPVVVATRFHTWRSFTNGCRVLSVTLRSPRPSGDARNDLIPAELYEPTAMRPRGAVVLLPIWRGIGPALERYVASQLARRGYAVMIVPLPYQFGRVPLGVRSGSLTITDDLPKNRTVLLQAVADARTSRLWLRDRGYREDRIAVMGISLGGHVAALAYGADPGFALGAFVLTGGDIADLLWNDSRETRWIKRKLVKRGVTFEEIRKLCVEVEPLRYARPWRGPGVVMAAARRDKIVPPANVRALRTALGSPPILWLDATHTSGVFDLPRVIAWIADGFAE
jgi:dienelactone hydrolase